MKQQHSPRRDVQGNFPWLCKPIIDAIKQIPCQCEIDVYINLVCCPSAFLSAFFVLLRWNLKVSMIQSVRRMTGFKCRRTAPGFCLHSIFILVAVAFFVSSTGLGLSRHWFFVFIHGTIGQKICNVDQQIPKQMPKTQPKVRTWLWALLSPSSWPSPSLCPLLDLRHWDWQPQHHLQLPQCQSRQRQQLLAPPCRERRNASWVASGFGNPCSVFCTLYSLNLNTNKLCV